MCGIVGFVGLHEPGLVQRMCGSLVHRGPDDEGFVELPETRISLGMRRLSIIDVEGGKQPVSDANEKVHLVFNGEIYNHRELRRELVSLGHVFNTRCDTEVVLVAYLEWGREAWSRLNGMFAFALADTRGSQPKLVVVRDRFGIKPLYYRHKNGTLIFASELKALLTWSGFSREIDLGSLRNYLTLRYVPGPRTMFRGVVKLLPGHEMEFAGGDVRIRRWWAPPAADTVDPHMDRAGAVKLFGDALRDSVRRHMISDVPIGAYLSSGVDSTVITALMAEASSQPVRTFSIGFPDFPGNELDRASRTAQHLGTLHTPIECRHADMASLPDIVRALDQPFGDPIVLPMYVLAREARKDVAVVQCGEGADEILGGYMFHRQLLLLEKLRRFLPRSAWLLASRLFSIIPMPVLERGFDYPGELGTVGRSKLAGFLKTVGEADLIALYRALITMFDPDDIVGHSRVTELQAHAREPLLEEETRRFAGTALQRLVEIQFHDWLPDQALMKLDKLTMAHSLEGRVPFMDDAVVEAAARVPDAHKLGRKTNKAVLRDFAKTILPAPLLESPKMAFYVPLGSYASSREFRDLYKRTMDPDRLRRRGLFDPDRARALFQATPSEGFLPLKRGFSLMMLELWFEEFCPDATWA